MTVSFYCHCSRCNGKANQLTASQTWPQVGKTIAAPRSWPFGSLLTIEGFTNQFRVEDRLARKYDNRIDVFVSNHKEAKQLGISQRKVRVISEN